LIPTNFFAVYQGENDRELHANLGRIYRGLDLTHGRPMRASGERIRIGILSAYFRDHTIGRLNLGRIRHLRRDKFEAIVLSVGRHEDDMARAFSKAADQYVILPREVAAARRQIADLNLDILFFADVGMDALTYTLAFSRMAPLQCATWGHPVTTGSPTIDYFLSSELLETPEGDGHYTEKLLRLPSLGTYYYRPQLVGPPKMCSDFGLDPSRHIYLCPQTLFKFHPGFDPILAEILRADPNGDLVLIEGRVPNWTRLLRERFERTMPDVAARIRYLPPQPNQDFLHLLKLADVVLDPIHFGGGNSSYEALAMGTPIITLPGPYLRGRITQALYAKMGILQCVAVDAATYVEQAVRIATDAGRRADCSAKILQECPVLFEDPREVDEISKAFAAFF
jgi:predicted O-linked N-acetylglucosamine transferase (SPINDLY family)